MSAAASREAPRSSVRDPPQQRQRFVHQRALVGVELALQNLAQPGLAPGASHLQQLQTGRSQLNELAAPVGRVRPARDKPAGLKVVDRLRHRLRAHPLARGKVADARRAFAIKAAEHGQARHRRPRLGAESPDHAPDRFSQLMRQLSVGRLPLPGMARSLEILQQADCAGDLCIVCRQMPALNPDRYKWVALTNATLAVLLAVLDGSITIIAMPDIFRGIHLDPLVPANSFYLLWMILGYLVVTSVLVVSLGRLGDMVGRVKIYRLGFVIYTVASLLLAIDWMHGRDGATYLIVLRVVQGIGGACLLANAAAIITDAFPPASAAWRSGSTTCRRQRHVHRPRARRHPGADRLATCVPDLGARRAVRNRLGLSQPA